MPRPLRDSQERSYTIGWLVHREANEGSPEKLMGLVLPPFQRPPVWTGEQQERFIESIWYGLPIGTYCINRLDTLREPDLWLLDGQQRIRAIRNYIAGDFQVFGWVYPDLPVRDQRRFQNCVFPCAEVRIDDVAILRVIYDRLAYGGTPHTGGAA
jgi:hypothetical protein